MILLNPTTIRVRLYTVRGYIRFTKTMATVLSFGMGFLVYAGEWHYAAPFYLLFVVASLYQLYRWETMAYRLEELLDLTRERRYRRRLLRAFQLSKSINGKK